MYGPAEHNVEAVAGLHKDLLVIYGDLQVLRDRGVRLMGAIAGLTVFACTIIAGILFFHTVYMLDNATMSTTGPYEWYREVINSWDNIT